MVGMFCEKPYPPPRPPTMEARAVIPDTPFAAAREKMERLIDRLSAPEALGLTHSELEQLIRRDGLELLRQLLQDHLDLRGPGARVGEVRDKEGHLLTHQRMHTRRLMTLFGPVEVHRLGYGDRGTSSLHPLDADLNLPKELYSLGVRRQAAEEAAKSSFDETTLALATTTGAEVPKRQIEEIVERAAVDFDAFYSDRQGRAITNAAEAGPILVLSMDGKGVVMRKEDLREPTRRKAEQRVHKMTKRLARGEKRNAKRMSTVAAVYTIEPFVREPQDIVRELAPVRDTAARRPRPENKRVWATLEKAPDEVVEEMAREAASRDPERRKQWVALVDGNEMQIRLLEEMAVRQGVELCIVLDLIHVIEYLWRAATCFCEEGSKEAEQWVSERLLRILEGRASDVAAGIRRSATRRELENRKAADECAQYLLNHKAYIHYNEYLGAGYPIATGVIEGACRHVVKDRMDITGARWSLAGAEAILRLRSLRASGDFNEYWRFHEQQERRRNHTALYADGKIPLPRLISRHRGNAREHLKLVR